MGPLACALVQWRRSQCTQCAQCAQCSMRKSGPKQKSGARTESTSQSSRSSQETQRRGPDSLAQAKHFFLTRELLAGFLRAPRALLGRLGAHFGRIKWPVPLLLSHPNWALGPHWSTTLELAVQRGQLGPRANTEVQDPEEAAPSGTHKHTIGRVTSSTASRQLGLCTPSAPAACCSPARRRPVRCAASLRPLPPLLPLLPPPPITSICPDLGRQVILRAAARRVCEPVPQGRMPASISLSFTKGPSSEP